MRLAPAMILLAILAPTLGETGDSRPALPASERAPAVYDPDPAHIWNRVYAALLIRDDSHGGQWGTDSLDPPLWPETEHLLVGPSHARALRVLDEFLQTHAENKIRDPLKRAILQRDLWAVFDWSVRQESDSERPPHDNERSELQVRLAEVLRRLALTLKEFESLPDNYAQAVASGEFAREYDPAHPEQPFLPPDVFESGPWVYVNEADSYGPQAVAIEHVSGVSGRSRFLVFLRLPGGRKATLDYLQALWNFPEPWVHGSDLASEQAIVNPALPSFPAGTEVALVRQMVLFDSLGNLAPAPITESIQLRVYRSITATPERYFGSDNMEEVARDSGQDFYQFTLNRRQLFANQAGGLKATARDERELPTFQARGDDLIDEISEQPALMKTWPPVLQTCLLCHSGGGIHSLNSREKLLKPNRRQQETSGNKPYPPRWWVNAGTTNWKQDRYDWGLLHGYWRASAGQDEAR
jgi:hypothetical protein